MPSLISVKLLAPVNAQNRLISSYTDRARHLSGVSICLNISMLTPY